MSAKTFHQHHGPAFPPRVPPYPPARNRYLLSEQGPMIKPYVVLNRSLLVLDTVIAPRPTTFNDTDNPGFRKDVAPFFRTCHSSLRFLGATSPRSGPGVCVVRIGAGYRWECRGEAAGGCTSSGVSEHLYQHGRRMYLASGWQERDLQAAFSTSV